MKLVNRFVALSTSLVLGSCTLIFLPAKQKVNFNTTDDNSVVFVDNIEIGRGKTFTTKIKKNGAKQVVMQTPGYRGEHVVLLPVKRSPISYPLMVLDLPWLATGYGFLFIKVAKNFDYKKDIDLVNSIKYNKRLDSEKYVNIDAIKLDIKDKTKDIQSYTVLPGANEDIYVKMEEAVANRAKYNEKQEAKKNKKKKKEVNYLSNKDNAIKSDDSKLSNEIYKTLKTTGYIDTVNKVFQDDNNTLVIRGSIIKLDEYTITSPKTYNSYLKFGLGINWFVMNTYGEILDSIYIYTYSGDYLYRNFDKDKGYENVYADAADKSYSILKENDIFKKHINIVTDLSIKEESLSIKTPKNLVKEVSDATLASVIVKRKDKGHGSGFAISNDGYILTNFHVIASDNFDKPDELKVLLSTGEELSATVVRYNRARDIALLKVDTKFEKAFELKSTKEFKNLQEVYTIGAPKSIELGQSISLGLISNERKANNNNILQLSMSINSGNSGGPLFDKSGLLHGVIQAKLVGFATEGVGFAIPSYLIPDYLNIKFIK